MASNVVDILINDIVNDGQWHSIVIVGHGINLRLFIDGNEVMKS